MNARRLLRWLRLLVACVAFVVVPLRPALAGAPLDEIVLVATEEAHEEARAEARSQGVSPASSEEPAPERVESPRLVSRRYLANCALLL